MNYSETLKLSRRLADMQLKRLKEQSASRQRFWGTKGSFQLIIGIIVPLAWSVRLNTSGYLGAYHQRA
jgi:hypothetical protein